MPNCSSHHLLPCSWEGFGWCIGTIEAVNDARHFIGTRDNKVNFYVKYDMDAESEPTVPHVLEADMYKTVSDAEYDSCKTRGCCWRR